MWVLAVHNEYFTRSGFKYTNNLHVLPVRCECNLHLKGSWRVFEMKAPISIRMHGLWDYEVRQCAHTSFNVCYMRLCVMVMWETCWGIGIPNSAIPSMQGGVVFEICSNFPTCLILKSWYSVWVDKICNCTCQCSASNEDRCDFQWCIVLQWIGCYRHTISHLPICSAHIRTSPSYANVLYNVWLWFEASMHEMMKYDLLPAFLEIKLLFAQSSAEMQGLL